LLRLLLLLFLLFLLAGLSPAALLLLPLPLFLLLVLLSILIAHEISLACTCPSTYFQPESFTATAQVLFANRRNSGASVMK
jgi:hypothetical protein